jgi:hypothetical protein
MYPCLLKNADIIYNYLYARTWTKHDRLSEIFLTRIQYKKNMGEISMAHQHPYQRFYEKVKPALKSKAEELNLLGIGAVKEDDVWLYLTQKKWKRPKEEIHLHELVNDILSLNSSQFMTFMTIEAYKSPNIFEEISAEEMRELLKD